LTHENIFMKVSCSLLVCVSSLTLTTTLRTYWRTMFRHWLTHPSKNWLWITSEFSMTITTLIGCYSITLFSCKFPTYYSILPRLFGNNTSMYLLEIMTSTIWTLHSSVCLVSNQSLPSPLLVLNRFLSYDPSLFRSTLRHSLGRCKNNIGCKNISSGCYYSEGSHGQTTSSVLHTFCQTLRSGHASWIWISSWTF